MWGIGWRPAISLQINWSMVQFFISSTVAADWNGSWGLDSIVLAATMSLDGYWGLALPSHHRDVQGVMCSRGQRRGVGEANRDKSSHLGYSREVRVTASGAH